MKRVAKHAGVGHIVVEDAPIPEIGDSEVLVRAEASLVSRGSEIWHRYAQEEALPHRIMGYSLAGVVEGVGADVRDVAPGQRVAAVAPHAEYATADGVRSPASVRVMRLPDSVSAEAGTFWPLVTSCRLWAWAAARVPRPNSFGRAGSHRSTRTRTPTNEFVGGTPQRVVVLGQGLVGSLYLQVVKADGEAQAAAVDVCPLRCELADRVGADRVINAADEDPVAAVRDWTGGAGADVVVYAVGGPSGPAVFEQAVEMAAPGGLVQVLGLYEGAPLPLDSGAIQGKRLVGGSAEPNRRADAADAALALLADGRIATETMITHRFRSADAPEAFDLLYHKPHEAMAVMIDWSA